MKPKSGCFQTASAKQAGIDSVTTKFMKTIIRISSHSLGTAVCAVVMLALATFRAKAGVTLNTIHSSGGNNDCSADAVAVPGNDAIADRASELTGIYTQVAVGDPDFGGGTNAPWILGTGLVESQLGPNGLPVLSASGIAQLGTSSDMDPVTHELLWWSPGASPYVSLDSDPVQINSMPFSYGYPNVNWYPTGQTSDANFYRTVEWQGTFKTPKGGSISLDLSVDDDAWVFIDGTLVAEDHYGYTSNTTNAMSAGTHLITVFYDDRQQIYDAMYFSSSVPFAPVRGHGEHGHH
jgi:hypothetical protein